MPLFWLALGIALVSAMGSLLYVTSKGLEAFRSYKTLSRTLGGELERIEQATGRIEQHLSLAAASGTRLEAELAQLRRSRARVNVLTSALADVRASVGRVTAVYPRK